VRPVHEALVRRALDRQLHDVVQRAQRRRRLVIARHQPGHLAERRERARREDRAGDERADRELALGDQVHAENHHRDARQLLHRERDVDDRRGQRARLDAEPRHGSTICSHLRCSTPSPEIDFSVSIELRLSISRPCFCAE
jgi:hypothetical protein